MVQCEIAFDVNDAKVVCIDVGIGLDEPLFSKLDRLVAIAHRVFSGFG